MKKFATTAALACAALITIAGCASEQPKMQPVDASAAMQTPTPQMQAVLDELGKLNGKPIETLTAQEARRQPTPTDAVIQLKKKTNKSTAPLPGLDVSMTKVPGKGGDVPVRVYTPAAKTDGKRPVIVYIHGGGWVIATLDTYDASARSLALQADAIVLSVDYRQAPEHKFPAAHEDVYSVVQYALEKAGDMGGDTSKVAVVGESAGGNLATAACLMAKDRGGKMPVAQILVYPITGDDFNTPSYVQNAKAKPLNKPMMEWFFDKYAAKSDHSNKYLLPIKATPADLKGLPPATVINAAIDPLRSDGEMYAKNLKDAGVDTYQITYDGVVHEFFGMADVVPEAATAQGVAVQRLKSAFGTK